MRIENKVIDPLSPYSRALKKIEESGKFRETVHNLKTNEKKKFFFKGAENDWKKILDKKLAEDMTQYYKEDLKILGYYE